MPKFKLEPHHQPIIDQVFAEFSEQMESAEPVDFEGAKKAICNLYKLNGVKPPKYFYHAASPLEAQIAVDLLNVPPETTQAFRFWFDLEDNLDFDGIKWSDVENDLDIKLYELFLDYDNYEADPRCVYECCEADYLKISQTIAEKTLEIVGKSKNNFLKWGHQNCLRLAHVCTANCWSSSFIVVECARRIGVPFASLDCAKIEATNAVSKACGFYMLYEDFAFICDRPVSLHAKNRKLHNENGMALSFSDGSGIYSINGVSVPEYVVLSPDDITPVKILGTRNAEVRRVMIERMGSEKFGYSANAEIIHEDLDAMGHSRRLLKVLMEEGDWVAIEVTDSSKTKDVNGNWVNKKYVLSVNSDHYDGRAGRECHAAIASTWRHGYDNTKLFFEKPEDYRPIFET